MRSVAIFCLALSLGCGHLALAADAPLTLAGIRLGDTLDAARARLRPLDADPECHRCGLAMAFVAPTAGFRSGYVDYGQCANAGRIVRVKMHYRDASLEFFNRILAALKKRYGEPNQWRGNAFGTLRTWKWSLTTADGTPVSLILMHYAGDDGAFTQGNSIRIAATDLVRQEERCLADRKNVPDKADTVPSGAAPEKLDLEWFLPQ